jgi:nucleotide-binding universal stress UspA family protein
MAVRCGVVDAGSVMQTIMCGVDESRGAAEAIEVAAGLSKCLGLRLVLAHVVDQHCVQPGGPQAHEAGTRLLERIARKHNLERAADRRAEVGDRASELSRIASEEAAVMIVVGSRGRHRRGRGRLSRLLLELRSTAPCAVVVVPPLPRR